MADATQRVILKQKPSNVVSLEIGCADRASADRLYEQMRQNLNEGRVGVILDVSKEKG